MKTLNTCPNNSEFAIVVRFSFLNNGSKLKSNYKPATGNLTISSTVISNNEVVVSHNRVLSLLEVGEVVGGRATLCFNDPTRAAELIEEINNKLVDTNVVDVGITSSDNIIYNVGENVYSSSLTLFQPSVEIIAPHSSEMNATAEVAVSNALRTAPNSETVPFDYESFLAMKRQQVSDLSQVRAAKSQLNVNKTVI